MRILGDPLVQHKGTDLRSGIYHKLVDRSWWFKMSAIGPLNSMNGQMKRVDGRYVSITLIQKRLTPFKAKITCRYKHDSWHYRMKTNTHVSNSNGWIRRLVRKLFNPQDTKSAVQGNETYFCDSHARQTPHTSPRSVITMPPVSY